MLVEIKRLSDTAILPTYGRDGDACLDAYADDNITIHNWERELVSLGIALQLPHGYECVIRPRSGNSKKGIDIAIGTVDENYRGELKANVINNTGDDIHIYKEDRICQLAIRKTEQIEWIECDELQETNRNADGFGSSGV